MVGQEFTILTQRSHSSFPWHTEPSVCFIPNYRLPLLGAKFPKTPTSECENLFLQRFLYLQSLSTSHSHLSWQCLYRSPLTALRVLVLPIYLRWPCQNSSKAETGLDIGVWVSMLHLSNHFISMYQCRESNSQPAYGMRTLTYWIYVPMGTL